jgi:hypothetical protein
MEAADAILIGGLDWRRMPRGRDLERHMRLTLPRWSCRPCPGALSFASGQVDDSSVHRPRRAGVQTAKARLDLRLHDGEMCIDGDRPFAVVLSILAAASAQDTPPKERLRFQWVVGRGAGFAIARQFLEAVLTSEEAG